MSYEQFRNEMTEKLLNTQTISTTQQVISTMDMVATGYDIEPKCTDLIVQDDDGVPPIVRIYIAAKGIEGKSIHTLKQYRGTLTYFFKATGLPLEKVTANDIRIYLYNYQNARGISNASLDSIRSILTTFFEWCVNEDYLPKNPAKKIQKIKYQKAERAAMSLMELEVIRSACRSNRERALIEFLYSSGCRISEVCNMMIAEVDLNNRSAIVQHGKGDKRRTIYLSAAAAVILRKYLKARRDKDPHLFVRTRRYHTGVFSMTPEALRHDVSKVLARTNISKHVTPHIFRHTFATLAMQSGMPVEQVQRVLGHANISTTMIYAKCDDEDVKRSHSKFIA